MKHGNMIKNTIEPKKKKKKILKIDEKTLLRKKKIEQFENR
jgi:hypothetical protein